MSESIKRILYTTDLSRRSPYPLERVLDLAKATGAEVRILHVCEPLSEDARLTLTLFMNDEKARKKALSRRFEEQASTLSRRLDAFWAALPAEGQAMRARVVAADVKEGHAPETILREARTHGCDLIAMGAHQRGTASTYIGSVVKRVQRRAEVMTLVIPYRSD